MLLIAAEDIDLAGSAGRERVKTYLEYFAKCDRKEYRYHLKVPDIHADAIDRVLQGDAPALSKYRVQSIQPGDTLCTLARHFGVSVDLIKYSSPGINPGYPQIDEPSLDQHVEFGRVLYITAPGGETTAL